MSWPPNLLLPAQETYNFEQQQLDFFQPDYSLDKQRPSVALEQAFPSASPFDNLWTQPSLSISADEQSLFRAMGMPATLHHTPVVRPVPVAASRINLRHQEWTPVPSPHVEPLQQQQQQQQQRHQQEQPQQHHRWTHTPTVSPRDYDSTPAQKFSRQVLSSVYRADHVYVSYGPPYALGSDAPLERFYATLFKSDQLQTCVPPLVVQHSHYETSTKTREENPSSQARYHVPPPPEKRRVARRRTNSGNHQAKAPTMTPIPVAKARQKQRTSQTRQKETNETQASSALLEPKYRFIERLLPQSLPPPKVILAGRPHDAVEKIFRRIASFLDEQDAVRFAQSSRVVYAALDHMWWASVFFDPEKAKKGALLEKWPCYHGWCDNCGSHQVQITAQEPSKARLCSDCVEMPAMRSLRITDARTIYDVGSKPALTLFKMLPFHMVRKSKCYWVPHFKWIEEQTAPLKVFDETKPTSTQTRTRTSTANLFVAGPTSFQKQQLESQKRAARNRADESLQSMRSAETETILSASSSVDNEALPVQQEQGLKNPNMEVPGSYHNPNAIDERAVSFLYASTSNETEGHTQKRQRVGENETGEMFQMAMEDNGQNFAWTGPSQEDIMREVRYNYLKNEAAKVGMRLPEWGGPLRGTLSRFINGEWTELAKQGIAINDFGAMIQHLQAGMN